MTTVDEYCDGDELREFLSECGQRRDLRVIGHGCCTPYKVNVDRFTSLWEIRLMVAKGQDEAEEDNEFENWPTWRRLFFVVDDKRVITMEQEKKVIVWEMMEDGHKIYVKQANEFLIRAYKSVKDIFVRGEEIEVKGELYEEYV